MSEGSDSYISPGEARRLLGLSKKLPILPKNNAGFQDENDMSLETSGWWFWRRTRAVAVVTIVDSCGNPIEGATVYGHWSGPTGGDVFGVTDINGQFT